MDELPFMATEELIVRAVKAGGDRQDVHERIRQHSIAAAHAVKHDGKENDLLERLAADPSFKVSIDDLQATLDPSRFVGRAPQQVEEFLTEVVAPLLSGDEGLRPPRATRCAYERRDHGGPAPSPRSARQSSRGL